MRFLCFHGMGTNAKVFEKQTVKLRQALGRQHEFFFVNGTVPTEPAPGTESAIGGSYCFHSQDLVKMQADYNSLLQLLVTQGPFDGVVGFSEGGGVASSLIVQDAQHQFHRFKCAIFFSAASPVDMDVLETGVKRHLDVSTDGVVINIPTAHIWSHDGDIHPGMGKYLVQLCNKDMREEFIHNLGHTIPGSLSNEGFPGTLRAIERTIERARA